ncbi:pyocin knob domain-containing protein [Lactobacillus helveticus]|uniref:pyocin knob domain-containing protein n=1 Tax=Lactobacillus helveticus TaxID=1587 RepID=UPI001C64DE41|nr:pyocin knob domain-containing protein [Lactobacillus helveticus]MBW8009358.1 hypothetical protein [Lactobacillus helveticus]MBW8019387.1 hypothetical protein [Lactobacillus helveticus]MBW8042667.1 hypothetical protein [Lactobacillus helveticus]MBW8052342.1 hypothetical protein [Lactobacillus helveticus]
MSLIRDPVIITAVGHQMMTAGGDITYTKATLYGQDISHLTKDQLESLTSIGNPLLTVPVGISDKSVDGEQTTIALEATFTNANLKADLPYKAVGFFAKKDNGEEKLVILGVANSGAYLAAASPDGVASDALDVKVAIAIGDATNVTAVVDPAGSVTPATLSGAINKATHDLTAKIDTKADKTDVTAQFATKADKTTVEQELTTKANASDVYTKKQVDDALSSRDTAIATKADKATVDAEISKIDFTPYAKTADVNKQIKTVTDLANSKVSADYSYSKAELDKKLLAVTTDASGKVNANQVASMIADKADKTYVDNQIASIDFGKIKFRKQYVNSDGQTADKTWSATKNQDGTYTIDLWQDDWTASKLSGVLVQLPNKADTSTVNAQIADAKNTAQSNLDKVKSDLNGAINTKANSSDLTALDKKAVKSVGIYPNNLHFDSGSFNYWSGEVKASPDANGYALIDLTDDTSVQAAANQLNAMLTGLNHLQGKQTKDSADANALSETGVYYCSSPAKNFPVSQWGTLVTSNGNGARASQLYFPDDNSAVWFRTLDGDWRGWVRLANIDDVNNAESSLTSSINTKANAAQTTANAVSNKVNVTVPLFRRITAGNTWNDILGASNGDTPVLVSIRDEGGANTLGNYSAAVAFGGGDTKGVLNVAYSDHTARIIGGNGNAPVWHEDIAWKSDISNLQNIINQQNQTIQSLTSRLNNAENEINYIKANYVEGRTFPASQEAQANSWESENPQRLAFITK